MTTLLLATRNPHKTRELAAVLGREFKIRDLHSEPTTPAIAETGSTFEENAIIKALAVSRLHPDELVIADDSGLEVDALGGAPGIYSARYAGTGANDRANVEKLLRDLAAAPQPVRSGRFRCVIAIARGGKLLGTVSGKIDGTISDQPRGKHGFGYDPILVPEGFSQTFAELPPAEKNRISHRSRAAKKLRDFLGAG